MCVRASLCGFVRVSAFLSVFVCAVVLFPTAAGSIGGCRHPCVYDTLIQTEMLCCVMLFAPCTKLPIPRPLLAAPGVAQH